MHGARLTVASGATTFRHVRRAAFGSSLLACAALVAGCPDSRPPAPPVIDLGPRPDGFAPPGIDTDADGVCDDTEFRFGLDPRRADTDADGFPDWFEIAAGFEGNSPSSPPRSELLPLVESAESEVVTSIVATVNGEGETYTGSIDPQIVRDGFGVDAGNFFVSAMATGAEPLGNVVRIDAPARTWESVRGRTLLFSEVRFRFGTETARGCVRGYPFRYYTKSDAERIVASSRRILILSPPGATPATGPWCAPAGPCW